MRIRGSLGLMLAILSACLFLHASKLVACAVDLVDFSSDREALPILFDAYYRATTSRDESLIEPMLYSAMRSELLRYLSHRHFDANENEEIFHDVFFELIMEIRRARAEQEVASNFLAVMYLKAKYKLFQLPKKRALPFGDMQWLADSPGKQSIVFGDQTILTAVKYEPIDLSVADYSTIVGSPMPISARQLNVSRGLALGNSHGQIAVDLAIDLRQVHDAIGNIERKLIERFNDPQIRRSAFRFLPDLSAKNRVFVECRTGGIVKTVLLEGPMPLESAELAILSAWVRGENLSKVIDAQELDGLEGRRIYLKLLYEKRRDYEELFSAQEASFSSNYELSISAGETEYALLKAFGLEKDEIATVLEIHSHTVTGRHDRLREKLEALFVKERIELGREIDFRRPYYSVWRDDMNQPRIVLTDSEGERYLVRLVREDGRVTGRKSQVRKIKVPKAELEKQIAALTGVTRKVARLHIIDGQSVDKISKMQSMRPDQVRKHLAHASFQFGIALGEPDLNLFNLVLE